MGKISLIAESGADISPRLAEEYGIRIVPMYVTFGEDSRPDGSFPPEEICEFYEKTGILPKTSCTTPADFERVFDEIHAAEPEGEILYLAYSAVTTASYQSALLAAEGRGYVTCIDTTQASAGQGIIVLRMAQLLRQHPEWTMSDARAAVMELIARSRMCFIPSKLEFLRAGGRCSNATALCGSILGIHPLIEMKDGRPTATKKYQGRMERVIARMLRDYSERNNLGRNEIWLMRTPGLPDKCRAAAEEAAKVCGFRTIHWVKTGGVITCHGGPAAFGIAGFAGDAKCQ